MAMIPMPSSLSVNPYLTFGNFLTSLALWYLERPAMIEGGRVRRVLADSWTTLALTVSSKFGPFSQGK
jgi:hypothetical protein